MKCVLQNQSTRVIFAAGAGVGSLLTAVVAMVIAKRKENKREAWYCLGDDCEVVQGMEKVCAERCAKCKGEPITGIYDVKMPHGNVPEEVKPYTQEELDAIEKINEEFGYTNKSEGEEDVSKTQSIRYEETGRNNGQGESSPEEEITEDSPQEFEDEDEFEKTFVGLNEKSSGREKVVISEEQVEDEVHNVFDDQPDVNPIEEFEFENNVEVVIHDVDDEAYKHYDEEHLYIYSDGVITNDMDHQYDDAPSSFLGHSVDEVALMFKERNTDVVYIRNHLLSILYTIELLDQPFYQQH